MSVMFVCVCEGINRVGLFQCKKHGGNINLFIQ